MSTHTASVDVNRPIRTVYDQWTQFESFPEFMEGVERVIQVDDTLTRWETKIGGVFREFEAQIVAQHPDELVAWNTVGGPTHGGVVTFQAIDQATTRVALAMQYEPEGLTEKAGTALGIVDSRISGDLKRFKEFIEKRGQATGSWRGDVSMSPQTHAAQEPRPDQPPETDPVLGDMPGVEPENYRDRS